MTIEFGVGKELRAARLKAELKISEIAEELNLSVEHLTAIEKDNYDLLPGKTYVVGFIKSYAKFLGLNDTHLIDRLIESGFVPRLEPVTPIKKDSNVNEAVNKSTLRILLMALFLIFVLAFVYFKVSSNENVEVELKEIKEQTITDVIKKESAIKAPENKNLSVQEQIEEAAKSKKKIEAKTKKILKLVGTKPVGARVMLTALADAWYQVYNPNTNKVYLNSVLKKGHSVWLENDPDALMDVGRPHKMAVSVDGKAYGAIGPSWGGVIKKMSIGSNFLIYDYFGEDLNKKSYNRWLKNKKQN